MMNEGLCSRRVFLATVGSGALVFKARPLYALAGGIDRIAWQREAKFGMFIHWGPYSVAGVEASWPILVPNGEITEAEYRALPSRFNPALFDPDAWVDLARKAGQRYMVFTAKHHDGFCMFDSAYTDYKITRTPFGKDIVRQLSDACHARHMPLGFYYSPPDMNHPGYRDTTKLSSANYRGEPERPGWPLYLEYMSLQLQELLTSYGPVAELWFDAVDPNTQDRYAGQRFVDEVRRLQPAALVNNRIGVPGDFVTPEQFIPKAIPRKGIRMDSPDHSEADKQANTVPSPDEFQPWEACMTINDTWAYRGKDRNFKSDDLLIRSMVEIISRGGNFLLDVGPQPDGRIQPEFIERLETMGRWVKKNAEAIYGSTYGPIQDESEYRTTERGASIYAFVMDASCNEIRLRGLHRRFANVRLLSNRRSVPFVTVSGETRIPIARDFWVDGIPVLEMRG
jgi:alpha-L-fucosidase